MQGWRSRGGLDQDSDGDRWAPDSWGVKITTLSQTQLYY